METYVRALVVETTVERKLDLFTYSWLIEDPHIKDYVSLSIADPMFSREERVEYYSIYGRDTSEDLSYVVYIDPEKYKRIYGLDNIVVEGSYFSGNPREILVSRKLARKLGIRIGDTVELYKEIHTPTAGGIQITEGSLGRYRVVGFFDTSLLESLKEVNGEGLLPKADISRVVLIGSPSFEYMFRLTLIVDDEYKLEHRGRVLAYLGFSVWTIDRGESKHALFILHLYHQGLELNLVPVVLSSIMVLSLILGIAYQRRSEIFTLSALGLDPSDIRNIFLLEGLFIGSISGVISYSIVTLILQLKTGVAYFLASIGIPLVACILGGYLPARKASIAYTPSLLRKWIFRRRFIGKGGEVAIELPFRIDPFELDRFKEYLESSKYKLAPIRTLTDYLGFKERRDSIVFRFTSIPVEGNFPFDCWLEVLKNVPKGSNVVLRIVPLVAKRSRFHYHREIIDSFRKILLHFRIILKRQ